MKPPCLLFVKKWRLLNGKKRILESKKLCKVEVFHLSDNRAIVCY